jgi:uncharacterized protein (TIGR02145 family)
MKKTIYLISITFLTLQSCSSGGNNETINSNSNSNNSSVVVDKDGNSYQTVKICNQTWMKSNLNVSHYRNGDIIPQVTDPTQWTNLTTGAWCYYNNASATGAIYGKLYNWYAVNDPRGLAPTGYHIPSDSDWISLTTCLGGVGYASNKMKEIGTLYWLSPNVEATNNSGFTALPAGNRSFYDGTFSQIQRETAWWSSTQGEITTDAWTRGLYYATKTVSRNDMHKKFGLSVRCMKD